MKIKDIVNRDIVNLTNCEFEPIHIPGSIQPHGFLFSVNEDNFRIEFCSENINQFTEFSYDAVLGKNFESVFGEDSLALLQNHIAEESHSTRLLRLKFSAKAFLCTVHKSNNQIIVEAEPASDEILQSDVYEQTTQFLSYMNETVSLKELCDLVANGTREITGYDRVMIYRFDKDYNGEVYAESVREDLEPFFGLHYPHTDIPAQARELYMRNLLRLIVDINYKPVPIFTIDDGNSDKNLDLSLSILRSTSPIHVQYLHNMGVGATLTISLIHKKKLWGLIACHHYGEKNLTPEIRLAAQLQGHFITSQIDIRQTNEEYDLARKSASALEKLSAYDFPATEVSFEEIVSKQELLEICNASGVAIVFRDRVFSHGLTPSADKVRELTSWLADYTKNSTLITDKLSDHLPENIPFIEEASGVIYHSLNIENQDCIIWFRPETLTEVNWAGDPSKAIIKDQKGLSPRNSFKLWKEIVKYKSKEWLQPEQNSAANYAHTLQRQILLVVVTQEEERYRKLSEVLQETNSELENINWISTHDLQEPLRKIQMISSRLLGKDDEQIPETVLNSVQRMNNSANRMQTLLIDILKYTRIQHIEQSYETLDVTDILEEIISDLSEQIADKQGKVEVLELPKIVAVEFLVKQLFSNLLQNSLKYSFEDKPVHITISSYPATIKEIDYNVLQFSDNGIGFDQKFAESIFNIFSRLHGQEEYKGSGVGLALCKKIMQVHKGFINAEGKAGEGATFKLYFPVEIDQ